MHSWLTARGKIVRVENPHGHDIELDVLLGHARIEDLLKLGVRTDPPIMTGPVEMKTSSASAPATRTWRIGCGWQATFAFPRAILRATQCRPASIRLSLRSRGQPKPAREHLQVNVPSDLPRYFQTGQRSALLLVSAFPDSRHAR